MRIRVEERTFESWAEMDGEYYSRKNQDEFYGALSNTNGVRVQQFDEEVHLEQDHGALLARREQTNDHGDIVVVQALHGILHSGRSSYGIAESFVPRHQAQPQLHVVRMNDCDMQKGTAVYVAPLIPGVGVDIILNKTRHRSQRPVIGIGMNSEGVTVFNMPSFLAEDAQWVTAGNNDPLKDMHNPLQNVRTWSLAQSYILGALVQSRSVIRPNTVKTKEEKKQRQKVSFERRMERYERRATSKVRTSAERLLRRAGDDPESDQFVLRMG